MHPSFTSSTGFYWALLLCATLVKELPRSQRAQNSGFRYFDSRNTGDLKGQGNISNPEERGQGKLPGTSKSKLRSIRWTGLAREDFNLWEQGKTVCTAVSLGFRTVPGTGEVLCNCLLNEWVMGKSVEWLEHRYKRKQVKARKYCMFEHQSSVRLENRVCMWVWGRWGDEETGAGWGLKARQGPI